MLQSTSQSLELRSRPRSVIPTGIGVGTPQVLPKRLHLANKVELPITRGPNNVVDHGTSFKSCELTDFIWSDFDHSLSLYLGYSGTTRIVYETDTYSPVVLESCSLQSWTTERLGLIRIANSAISFIPTRCYFSHEGQMFIGTQVWDVALSDIMACAIELFDIHIRAVLKSVMIQNH